MRLIDADVLIEALQNEPKYSIELPANMGDAIQKLLSVHQKAVVDVVEKQPTAYNVDKVVEESKEISKWVAYNNHDRDIGMTHRVVPFEALEKIIRKGGAE